MLAEELVFENVVIQRVYEWQSLSRYIHDQRRSGGNRDSSQMKMMVHASISSISMVSVLFQLSYMF